MKSILMTASAIAVMAAVSPAAAGTLDTVKERGAVRCGVSGESAGFSAPSDSGEWRGLDVDYCRAVAAAVFGDGSKVQFVALTSKERFAAKDWLARRSASSKSCSSRLRCVMLVTL